VDRERLAAKGIEPEYHDIWGNRHVVTDEIADAILKSLGGDSVQEQPLSPIEPVVVVREDAASLRIWIPAEQSGASMKLEIQWEHGELQHQWFWTPELRTVETREIGGHTWIAKQVPLPSPLRLGYHEIRLYWVWAPVLERFAEAKFIVCPKRAVQPEGRMAGVAVSLYGLRSSRNWGCGDFTDLISVIDTFAAAGANFIALNPLHAIPNRQPYNTSPYLPQSSLYRNFIYLDVAKIGPVTVGPGVDLLRAEGFVEYELVAKVKLGALRAFFYSDFLRDGGSREFDQYADSEGAPLHDFAVYCALDEEMHRRDPNVWLWADWPPEYHDPRSAAVAQFAEQHRQEVSFFKWLQWHVDQQLAEAQAYAIAKGMRIGLYHDLALATDRFGADLWAHRASYATGARVGAPPDDFSPNGQDWAFPPPNREAHRAGGYQLFAQSIRKNARHGGALRIDHVMRFFRLYWIPDGMDATTGAYVRDYADDLLGILALESVRGNFIVIGEDLGTVTDEVRSALSETGVLSYRVLWFERHGDGSFKLPGEYPERAAVSTTTHDLPTLAGFAAGRDIEVRREAGLIDEGQARERFAARADENFKLAATLRTAGFENDPIGFLLSTPCALAIVNQEDLTGEVEQQNLPGTTSEHPNWRRKMKVAVEDLGPLADRLRDAIAKSGR
jgi:4-alpha-glucanotransferase